MSLLQWHPKSIYIYIRKDSLCVLTNTCKNLHVYICTLTTCMYLHITLHCTATQTILFQNRQYRLWFWICLFLGLQVFVITFEEDILHILSKYSYHHFNRHFYPLFHEVSHIIDLEDSQQTMFLYISWYIPVDEWLMRNSAWDSFIYCSFQIQY